MGRSRAVGGMRSRAGRRRLVVLGATLVVALVAALQERNGPGARAGATLAGLGSPLGDAARPPIATSAVDCEGGTGCVSASRSWPATSSLTFASFSDRLRPWISERAPGQNSGTTVEPVGMTGPVEFMVKRGLPRTRP